MLAVQESSANGFIVTIPWSMKAAALSESLVPTLGLSAHVALAKFCMWLFEARVAPGKKVLEKTIAIPRIVVLQFIFSGMKNGFVVYKKIFADPIRCRPPTHLRDIRSLLYPPKGLEAHSQVPTQQPVLLFHGQERVEPVQQQLLHHWLS